MMRLPHKAISKGQSRHGLFQNWFSPDLLNLFERRLSNSCFSRLQRMVSQDCGPPARTLLMRVDSGSVHQARCWTLFWWAAGPAQKRAGQEGSTDLHCGQRLPSRDVSPPFSSSPSSLLILYFRCSSNLAQTIHSQITCSVWFLLRPTLPVHIAWLAS